MKRIIIAAMAVAILGSPAMACYSYECRQLQHQIDEMERQRQFRERQRQQQEWHNQTHENHTRMMQQNTAAGISILGAIIGGMVEADRQQRINASLADYEKDVGRTPELRRALLLEAATKYQLLMREPHNVRQSLCDTVRKLHTEYRGSVHACIRAGYLSYQSPKTAKQRRAEKRATEDDWKKRIFGQ